jgi:hypothetical protein
LLKYARLSGVEVKNREGAILSLDLEGIADRAVVSGLTPLAEWRWFATGDQGAEKLLLFESVLRARHGELSLVREADGNRMFEYERTTAREWRVKTMHCVAETFQQRSLVARVLT